MRLTILCLTLSGNLEELQFWPVGGRNHKEEKHCFGVYCSLDSQGPEWITNNWPLKVGRQAVDIKPRKHDSLSWFKRNPKGGDRKVCFHICSFSIMSLFSSDYFMVKINVELCHEKKKIQGKNLKNQTGTLLVVQWLWLRLPVQGGTSSIPGRGVKIPLASWPKNQNTKQKQYCNKFNKDWKTIHVKREREKLNVTGF